MRLPDKVAVVVGAGQTPGDTIGNGRATAILFAREGAHLLLVDKDPASAEDTRKTIADEGGDASVFEADITDANHCAAIVDTCVERYGRIDILHNNVGIGRSDSGLSDLAEDAWDTIFAVNLKGAVFTCKRAIAAMRDQGGGVITNVSSVAAIAAVPHLQAYRASKAALNAFTQNLAAANARYGIRVNAIMPGLINTPMAVEGQSKRRGMHKEKLIAERNARVPMGHMGSAWDVAHAALFLASDEAKFITGVLLPVDGGQSCRVG